MSLATSTIRDLRRRWKPQKERLATVQADHPTAVRFHRACSWLAEAEKLAPSQTDLLLIQQWIALNALYGRWDAAAFEPVADRVSWGDFLTKIHRLDQTGHLSSTLVEHKKLVLAILGNSYLNRHFWSAAEPAAVDRFAQAKRKALSWYVEKRWLMVSEQVLERIYLLRCQVVHGAATSGSKLNRDAMRHCTILLQHLLTSILTVWIDYGADEDWGPLCYPPVDRSGRSAVQRRR
jgi:hypothetical protein